MRIRTIKPEFWMHEGLAKCSEFARLLAIALLNWSDDEGYFMANPILIRGQVFPFLDDSKIIPRSLQDLSFVGWIRLGKDNQGRDVGFVINFSKHQRVDKPKPSSIKGCATFQDPSKNDPRSIRDESKEEGKGMERNGTGKGRDSFARSGTSSDSMQISWNASGGFTGIESKDITGWQDAFPAIDIHRQTAAANQWLLANPRKAKKSNYRRFLTSWFSRGQDRGGDVSSLPAKNSNPLAPGSW
jgi:hypothetical protein